MPSEIATKKTKSTVVSKIMSSRRHSWVGVQVILSGPQLQSSFIVSLVQKKAQTQAIYSFSFSHSIKEAMNSVAKQLSSSPN